MSNAPKFVFNCTDCGKCCERDVKVSLKDIADWMEHEMIYNVMPFLNIEGDYGSVSIQLEKQEKGGRNVCAMYDSEKKQCTIHENKPLECRSYPLGYNGNNFIVVDRDCPGLGQGKMTPEKLAAMRETAKEDYESEQSTMLLLPMLQGLFVKKFTIESQKAMDELSPEQREELENILRKK